MYDKCILIIFYLYSKRMKRIAKYYAKVRLSQ